MVTADDVLNCHFAQTQFREGYAEREVDDFLDGVVATLRHLDGGGPAPSRVLGAADVRGTRFTATKFRRGYGVQQVDALLEQVAAALDGHAHGERPVAPPPAAPGPTSGVGARLLRVLRGDPRP